MSILVKHYELGVFVDRPVVSEVVVEEPLVVNGHESATTENFYDLGYKENATEGYSVPMVVSKPRGIEIDWLSVLLWGWIGASSMLTAKLVWMFLCGSYRLGRARPLVCNFIEEAAQVACRKVGIDEEVGVYSIGRICSPVIWCWGKRPMLLLPVGVERNSKGVDWVSVFCHELAHWKRRDHVVGLMAEIIICVLPWHVILWWVKRRLIGLSEQACDDWVVASGGAGEDYAESLLDLLPGRQMGFTPAVVSSEKGLAGRVRRILNDECGNPRTGFLWGLAVGLLAMVMVTAIAFGQTRPVEGEERILHFPTDRSLGTIKVRDWDKPSRQYFDWEFLNQWDVFAEAKGDVIVPKDKKLALVINKEAAKDLSPLLSLQPDIFHILSLYNSEATDEALQYIVHLQGLEQLNLVGTKVTDDGLKQLTKLKPLKRLHLANTTIGDEGVANISGMSLEFIHLWRTNITDQALRHLSKIKSLEVLGLMWVDIGDPGLIYLKDLNQLKGLSLYETKITDKGIESLKDLTELEHLGLSDTAVSDIGIKHLSNLKNLKELDLDGTNVSDNGLEHLTSLPSLEKIRLPSHGSITDKGLASLCKIGSLKELNLTGGFTDQGLTQLLKLKNLEKLRIISASEITDDSIQHIAKIPSLKLLWIQHTRVSNKGIEKLKSLDKLEELMLSNNNKFSITYDSLQHLSQFPNLKKLDLSDIKASQTGLKYLGALTRLEELQIATFVTDVNALKVDETELQHLSKLKGLKSLRLTNNITDKGMEYLSDLTSLEKLEIFSSKPQITDEGIKYLVNNKKLKTLNISAAITDDGIKSLAELKSLESIYLHDATVTQESLDKLYVQLPHLQLLRFVSTSSPEKKLKTGQLAPDFEVTTITGDKFHLSEHRGKYVLVHFWATWCGPCIKSMPMIKGFHAELSEEKNFTSISLNCDSREYVMKDYIEKNGLTWPQAWINLRGDIKREYGVVGIPDYFLIDPDGKIILSTHHFEDIKEALTNIYSNKSSKKGRVLHFPKDRSMGLVHVGELRTLDPFWWQGWEVVGQAKGDVRVPLNKAVRLDISTEASEDILPLAALGPDDIQAITFNWNHCNINDSDLKNLSGLTGLKHLALSSTQIKGPGLVHLSGLKSLEALLLGRTEISDDSLKHVARFKSLKRLDLNSTKVTDAGLVHLRNLRSLERISLGTTGVSGKGFSSLADTTSINTLWLNHSDITDEGLKHIAKLKSLERLFLVNTAISDTGIEHISRLKALKELNLNTFGVSKMKLSGAALSHIAKVTSLESLELPGRITDADLAELEGLTKLKRLDIGEAEITGAGLDFLKKLKLLEFLQLPQGVTDKELETLKELASLEELWIQNSRITNKGLSNLSHLKSLKRLLLHEGRRVLA